MYKLYELQQHPVNDTALFLRRRSYFRPYKVQGAGRKISCENLVNAKSFSYGRENRHVRGKAEKPRTGARLSPPEFPIPAPVRACVYMGRWKREFPGIRRELLPSRRKWIKYLPSRYLVPAFPESPAFLSLSVDFPCSDEGDESAYALYRW